MFSNIEKNKWLQAVSYLLMGTMLMVTHIDNARAKIHKKEPVSNTSSGNTQNSSVDIMDLSVLPAIKGNVKQYLPTPYGNLGGLLLNDGTQIMFSTMFGEAVKTFVRPGQEVTIRGLKARHLPLLQAFLIENQKGLTVQEDSPEAGFSPVPITGPDLFVQGQISQLLHNLQGQVMGVVLKDGTVVYIRPSDIGKLGFDLQPGVSLFVRGMGSFTSMGKALQARLIGQTKDRMVELLQINAPPFGAPAGSPAYDYIPQ
ncbi:unnamed protein product [Commensalibacter communis]|uniref:Uncharacterized protein n=1 Tax=Commensalibacter communis TaxID=2972786 RepID=A0A9W4X6M9_9PROT|nr:hypothetical protein [Commensalibacter communis]CAI3935707.1 unnamed protein product [Commensalibacter communis]CAI3937652.1 unnamed protein product [Commensalibacter communis]CAI3942503.1 unnamed protein product [Commensalibacter communis]CAI3942666.1 unnamed protein product [Commensalibacter communis]CAI3943995.1 unnamed protein product [Commensalibacter communis]